MRGQHAWRIISCLDFEVGIMKFLAVFVLFVAAGWFK